MQLLKLTFKEPRHLHQNEADLNHPPLVIYNVVGVIRKKRIMHLVFQDNNAAVQAARFIGGGVHVVEHNKVCVYTDERGGYELAYMFWDCCEVAPIRLEELC